MKKTTKKSLLTVLLAAAATLVGVRVYNAAKHG